MNRYFGFIESIEEKLDLVTVRLKKEDYGLNYTMDLPLDMIDKDHLNLGQCFHVNLGDEHSVYDLNIEWVQPHNWTQEELDEVEEEIKRFLPLFDEETVQEMINRHETVNKQFEEGKPIDPKLTKGFVSFPLSDDVFNNI